MSSKTSLLPSSEVVQKRQQVGSDGSPVSPYSSAYSSDTEDMPIGGLLPSQSIPIKSVEELTIKGEEECSTYDGTSMDELCTRETSRSTSLDGAQAFGSPDKSLSPSPSTRIFTLNAPRKSSQHAEQMDQKLKLARLLLTRGKVGALHHACLACQPRRIGRDSLIVLACVLQAVQAPGSTSVAPGQQSLLCSD